MTQPSDDWTVLEFGDLGDRWCDPLIGGSETRCFDARNLGQIDTAGNFALMRTLSTHGQPRIEVDRAGREHNPDRWSVRP